MPELQWSYINTAIILTVLGYLWAQSKKVDAIYQALFGVDGRNGVLRRLDVLDAETSTIDGRISASRHATNDVAAKAIASWNIAMQKDIDEIKAELRGLRFKRK